jgi:hypothetical protein
MFCVPVGPSISSSVVLCSFFLLVYNTVPVLVVYFLSILCKYCSHFCWYSFISFTMFCAPVVSSISSSVVPNTFFLSFYNAVPVSVVYLCPSSVRFVATFAGTLSFPLLCSVSQLVPPSPPQSYYVPSSFWSIIQYLFW